MNTRRGFAADSSAATTSSAGRVWRRTLGLAAGVALATGALLGTAVAPAQAYSPLPTHTINYRDTDNCPCSISDPFDGTYFEKDAGGYAAKVNLYYGGSYIAKVEFHPYAEKLWVYDTKNDGDGIYAEAWWFDGSGAYHSTGLVQPTGTSSVIDYKIVDLGIAEGTYVYIDVYDASRDSWLTTAEVIA
ncbi:MULTISPECIES: hypothetical protein [Streptomyces]|uniref:hypothetical protein n=1 Tax=Streptomyces TaxID=1883 RepID=UPI00324D964E